MSYIDLTLHHIRAANRRRLPQFRDKQGKLCHSDTEGSNWLLSQWSNACLGELGEAANIIKKIERGDYTLEEKRRELADELADVLCYLDLLANRAGISLEYAYIHKFNEVSKRVGSDVTL